MKKLSTPFGRLSVRRVTALVVALVISAGVVGCGDDDSAESIPLSDWVVQFDQTCVQAATDLSNPGLTEEERTEVTDDAVAEMRAIGQPDENADVAADLLDAIDASSDEDLDDEEIANLDERVLSAMTTLGVSDECIGGAPG